MMKIKKTIIVFLSFALIFSAFFGCGSKKDNQEVKNGTYVLTTKTGNITMCDESGKALSKIQLNNNQGDFIYTTDSGNIYSKVINNGETIPTVMYAVNKNNKKLTTVLIYKNKISKLKDYILREKDIKDIYAYNGIFYYSTNNPTSKANVFMYSKPQILSRDGKITYSHSIPVNSSDKTIYVYMENYSNDYLNAIGIKNKLSKTDVDMLNFPDKAQDVFKIQGDIKTWTANNKYIYFFADKLMGQYDINKNEVTLHYGTISPKESQYIDGINKTIYLLSDFGSKSKKSVISSIDYDKMDVKKSIEIQYANPLCIYVEKPDYIYALYKTTNSEKNFSQLRVFKYSDYSEVYTISISYLPTKILANDDSVYLFNPYEDYFMIGAVGSNQFTKIKKVNKETDIFLINKKYQNDYRYDKDGNLMNAENKLIDKDGNLINKTGDKINNYGQRINENKQAINKDGDLIDRYNNVIDKSGNILKYVKNSNGHYYNSKGQFVDSKGNLLVQDEKGNWVEPNKAGDIKITGHYDEKGNFIIDQSVLDKYPNAYDLLEKNKTAKK